MGIGSRSALALLAAACASSGCVINLGLIGSGPVEEREVRAADSWLTQAKVVLVDVRGEISFQESSSLLSSSRNLPAEVEERLEAALEDDDVKAVVLRIDSPGGGVTASDVIHREVKRFREESGKPVVACLMDTAASGGYYVACAAETIVAHPTTVTGSIGVILQHFDLEELLRKIGVHADPITSGDHKDIASPLRHMTDEERRILQSVIDDLYARFVQVVAQGRTLAEPRVRELADGRIYTARQALDLGLVDRIGYLQDAIDLAMERAGIDDAAVITYQRSGESANSIHSEAIPGEINLLKLDLGDLVRDEAHFAYLWRPVP